MRGAGRIEQARFRGLYVTGTAAAYLERRAAEEGRERAKAVETAEVLHSGRGGGREETVTGSKGNEVQGELRGTRVAEGDIEGNEGVVGAGRLGTQGGEEDRRARARRGSHPDGARNNHTAVAEGDGCARPYLRAPPSRCGGSGRLSQVWVQGPEGWCQR